MIKKKQMPEYTQDDMPVLRTSTPQWSINVS